MYVSKAGAKVRSQKDRIIKMYEEENIRILDIAEKYHITESTLYKYFAKWGVTVIRGKTAYKKRYGTKKKFKKWNHWKRNFSKKFLEARAARTKKYGNKITYIKTKDDPHDKKLVNNILYKAYM